METRLIKTAYSKEDALNILNRNTSWINTADNKSSILLEVLSLTAGGFIYFMNIDLI